MTENESCVSMQKEYKMNSFTIKCENEKATMSFSSNCKERMTTTFDLSNQDVSIIPLMMQAIEGVYKKTSLQDQNQNTSEGVYKKTSLQDQNQKTSEINHEDVFSYLTKHLEKERSFKELCTLTNKNKFTVKNDLNKLRIIGKVSKIGTYGSLIRYVLSNKANHEDPLSYLIKNLTKERSFEELCTLTNKNRYTVRLDLNKLRLDGKVKKIGTRGSNVMYILTSV